MKILSVIPARGGSKRLPRKNILPLVGKPCIQWTIEACISLKSIMTTCVSTDDPEIAEISKGCGAEVPFLRPKDLSSDTASSFSVVKQALDYYSDKLGQAFSHVLLLQPTSPLRKAKDIKGAIDMLISKKADAVISVSEMTHTPLLSNVLPNDLSLKNFLSPAITQKRSQDLPKYYFPNGAIYFCNVQKLLEEETFYIKENIYAFIMPPNRSIDIDTKFDFVVAEALLRAGEK